MQTVPPLLLALFALAGPAVAAELNLGDMGAYSDASGSETSIRQFADVRPTDWAYQALASLIERYGCVAGYPNAAFQAGQAISRSEAAALLHACLDRIREGSDALRTVMAEFEPELAVLRGRVDGVEAQLGELAASRFSSTTKLAGQATTVLGASHFGGRAAAEVRSSRADYGATTLNYDLQLRLDTSFSGRDLLRTTLRGGDFAASSFGGAGPSLLSQLEVAFQQDCGAGVNCRDVVAIDRLFYQVPFGEFSLSVGGRIGQDDMLAIWPSVYPAETVLDVLTLAGAPGAYNKEAGAGAGLSWQRNGLAISANYVAANGDAGAPGQGGIATAGAGSSGSVQVGYSNERWRLAALVSRIQNGDEVIDYATNFVLASYAYPGVTTAYGLGGSWQPAQAGWIPSISAGWGLNATTYGRGVVAAGLVATSQSWGVGLQWPDAFVRGNTLGMAVAQPPSATRLVGGASVRDGNAVWEWWYQIQLTDQISITPALVVLSRPLGADTPAGKSFQQLGGLVKTSFRF